MYRIEFEPGDVGVFRTVEEVATAIKSGVITPRARIYHQASDKWLPIEFHPHYRKALEMVASGHIPTSPAHSTPVPASPPISIDTAPSGPHPKVQLVPPAPTAVEVIEPPVEPEPVEAATDELAELAEEPEAEPEPAPAPPEFVFAPVRTRDIRFIPLNEPAPLAREPVARHHEPAPAEVASMVEAGEPIPQELTPQPADTLGFAVEESGRPMFRPRFRVALSGNLRRPILLAVGGIALVFSAHVGLSVVASASTGLMGLGFPSLSFLSRESASGRAADSPTMLSETRAAARLPRDAELQGSPSFGASSAFPASRPGSPADAKRGIAGGALDQAGGSEKPESSTSRDSIVRAAPLAREIAVAAPKIAGLPGAANSKQPIPGLVSRYEAAYAAARSELETGFRTAGFANVFAPEHLGSSQGIRAARLSAGTASAYVAKYRRREAEIEAAYADSVAELVKSPADQRAWESRRILKESPEVAKLAGFLLEEIDSVFGVLASQDTAYAVKDGAIVFQDAAAARAYNELRPWLDRQAHQWADSASGQPSTAARVLRAIGSTRLPEGGAF